MEHLINTDVYFGEVDEEIADDSLWNDEDDDDNELETTPDEVLKILGFDPKEIN
jgi:hypothetical protein